jgi:hypothetical protein
MRNHEAIEDLSGEFDESMYMEGVNDVLFELERWPNFRRCVNRWLIGYPTYKGFPIFMPLNQDV